MMGPDAAVPCYAAVDLGANSFHLVIMRPVDNGLETVDAHRQIVRLGNGFRSETGQLRPEARRRALRCLAGFRERLQEHQLAAVRAVGTSVFRRLREDNRFLQEAEDALGCPIEIISGEEEARLIYLGATWGLRASNRMVVDVGGGSTEIVIGHGPEIETAISLDLGSATVSSAFFSGIRITQGDIWQARHHVREALERQLPGDVTLAPDIRAVGSSGTAKSLSWVLRSLHLSNGEITADGLQRIEPVLWQVDNIAQLSHVLNLNVRRAHVFPGGYAIMAEIFSGLGLDRMTLSTRALREGIVVTLLLQETSGR